MTKATIQGRPGPGQQDDRDPPRVLQHVGGEHEPDGGHVAAGPGEPDGPAQVEGPGPGGEQEAAHPQPLGDPQRNVELGQRPVERAHGEQVADVLVGHRPEGHPRVPQRRRLAHVAARIQVEVGLGVVADHAGPGGQHGDEGQHGQGRVVDGGPQPAGGAQSA